MMAIETNFNEQQCKLYTALAKAQGEFPVIPKNKTADAGAYSYKYADITDILKAIIPILSQNDLILTQPTKVVDGTMTVITRIIHVAGGSIESEYPVCSTSGEHQKMGGALTYARRYGVGSLLAIAVDEDTDGADVATTNYAPQNQRGTPSAASQHEAIARMPKNDGARKLFKRLQSEIPGCMTMDELAKYFTKAWPEIRKLPLDWEKEIVKLKDVRKVELDADDIFPGDAIENERHQSVLEAG